MALPTFTLTGSVEYLQGITLTPLSSTQVGLTCNFPWSSFLNTTDAASLLLVRPLGVMFNSSGQLVNTDGTPVQLLADDPSLGLSGPVQWQVKIGNQPAWWFNAPSDGSTIDLKDTSSVTGVFPSYATAIGPPGPQGPSGAIGPPGPQGPSGVGDGIDGGAAASVFRASAPGDGIDGGSASTVYAGLTTIDGGSA